MRAKKKHHQDSNSINSLRGHHEFKAKTLEHKVRETDATFSRTRGEKQVDRIEQIVEERKVEEDKTISRPWKARAR